MTTMPHLLRALRRRHGVTQVQLGDALGVSARAIQDWERGLSSPRAVDLERLATAYGVALRVGPEGWGDSVPPIAPTT